MLTTLRIKNLALVEDLTVELPPGYTAITGETGAGKSILIGALDLVLGERADRTLIRSGSDACTVEAVFDLTHLRRPIREFLAENGLEPWEEGRVVLKRTFAANGSNRQFINGSPTTLQTLARLGEWLVDIHGPHDHQSLLQPARQLEFVDAFGGLESLREQFAGLLRRRRELMDRKMTLGLDDANHARQLDLLRHQVREIETARLRPEEEDELPREHERTRQAARLLELSQTAISQLTDEDTGLLDQARALGRTLQELKRFDPDAACLGSLQDQAVALLRDLQSDVRHYAERIDLDPARLQALEERLNLVQSLKRKYGSTLEAVLGFGEHARQQLRQLEGRDAEQARLNAELGQLDAELARAGAELSDGRREAIPRLARAVSEELAALGFSRSHFDVALTSRSFDASVPPSLLSSSGLDAVEFQFAPNPGEPPRPLRAIASSGEIARVMLGIKTVVAAHDDVPLLVFDEVDANVGGETAHAVGHKMRAIADRRQVLCITHLAPVAAIATAHLVVTKTLRHSRSVTDLRPVEGRDRVAELARMLGGQSEAVRRHAAALLAEAAASSRARPVEPR